MTLTLQQHASATEFLAHARAKLEAREAENNLPLGLATSIERDATLYAAPFFATITGDGTDAGCFLAALMTPPYPLIVYHDGCAGAEALQMLAAHLIERGLTVAGVTSQTDTAAAFMQVWTTRTGQSATLHRQMRVFELRDVIPPQVPGESRWATAADEDLIAAWVERFGEDIREVVDDVQARKTAHALIQARDLLLWVVDGRTVSMAGKRRSTRHGAVVAFVYTPPAERGHGYASGVTAALSQYLLDNGNTFCALFTDLANPTSNSIYQKIGYRRLNDFDSYHFA
jgi:hypothetical protein